MDGRWRRLPVVVHLLHLLQRWQRGLVDASQRMAELEARNRRMEGMLQEMHNTLRLITRQVFLSLLPPPARDLLHLE